MTGKSGFARQFWSSSRFVIPAKAGIHRWPHNLPTWMPAFAGMTVAGFMERKLPVQPWRAEKRPPATERLGLINTGSSADLELWATRQSTRRSNMRLQDKVAIITGV